MEFTDVVRNRRMVRSFDARPLDPAVVDRVLSAGVRAPSAGFTQGVDLLVLEGPEQTARYWDAALPPGRRETLPWPGLLAAPLLVVVLSSEEAYRRRYAEPDKAQPADVPAADVPAADVPAADVPAADVPAADVELPWWHVDASFAALLLQLAAVDAGLGALFFQAHGVPALRQAFAIPPAFVPVGTVAMGHPAPDRPSSSVAARRRRPPEEVVHRGRW